MSAWGNKHNLTNAPVFLKKLNAAGDYVANVAQEFGNTIFGITPAAASARHIGPGWTHVVKFYGPIVNVAIIAGGNSYTNTSTVTINGDGNSGSIGITTNANGSIISATVLNPGQYYAVSNVAIANGSGANLYITLGNKAGHHRYETLVAMSSMTTANASSDYINLP